MGFATDWREIHDGKLAFAKGHPALRCPSRCSRTPSPTCGIFRTLEKRRGLKHSGGHSLEPHFRGQEIPTRSTSWPRAPTRRTWQRMALNRLPQGATVKVGRCASSSFINLRRFRSALLRLRLTQSNRRICKLGTLTPERARSPGACRTRAGLLFRFLGGPIGNGGCPRDHHGDHPHGRVSK